MIPRHRPPFGIARLLRELLRLRPTRLEELEAGYADLLKCRFAVWLPSARSGICRAIEFGLSDDATVFCPAFTCHVVHDAVKRSRRRIQHVDSCSDGLLMDDAVLSRPCHSSQHGIVLSEVFGHRYSSDGQELVESARLRIFDMAMAIPHAKDIRRLQEDDVALLSFGLGKSLYAGWGGMALTNSRSMAEWLKECRDRDADEPSFRSACRNNVAIFARTIAHTALLYRHARKVAERSKVPVQKVTDHATPTVSDNTDAALPREWTQRPTSLHLNLVRHNLEQSAFYQERRQKLAECYRTRFQSSIRTDRLNLKLAPESTEALSHYCIQIAGTHRESLRQWLWNHGVDSATLFDLRSRDGACNEVICCPNARRLSEEVVGLPLSVDLRIPDVERIAELVVAFCETIASSGELQNSSELLAA